MGKYDSIINMPHHVSQTRVRMSLSDRAAQFAPFAALTGYEESIKETARLTDRKIELSDEEKELISSKLNYIISNKITEPVEVIYFVPDEKKEGGKYEVYIGSIRIIDQINHIIYFKNKTSIDIEEILSINNEILESVFLN